MKTTIYNVFAIMMAMACSSILFPATAQANKKEEYPMIHGSENPFPLSEEQRLSLLQEVEKEVKLYRGRYNSPDLSVWEESDPNAYLIARARRSYVNAYASILPYLPYEGTDYFKGYA